MSESRRPRRRLAAIAAVVFVAGCTSLFGRAGGLAEVIRTIAILPLERAEVAAGVGEEEDELRPRIAFAAERVVTAQLYGVLVERPLWKLVPDLSTEDALAELPARESLALRAQELGKATEADAVLFGSVSRFQDRVGTELGATRPASVSFELALVMTETGEVVWRGEFNETQSALSSNLFNWWMFWRGGPRWFSAREFSRLGVERLIEGMEDRLS